VVASFYEPQFLTESKLLGDLNALVIIGVLGTALAGLRKIIPSERTIYEPRKLILDLSATTHYFPKRWQENEHTEATYKDIKQLYPYSFVTLFWEMLGIFIAPIQMISMAQSADKIYAYMRSTTTQYNRCAFYSKHGCFQKKKDKYENSVSGDASNLVEEVKQYPYKVAQSIASFKMEYPTWEVPDYLNAFFDQLARENPRILLNRSFSEDKISDMKNESVMSGLNLSSKSRQGTELEKEQCSMLVTSIQQR
jgi:hypothetical protein